MGLEVLESLVWLLMVAVIVLASVYTSAIHFLVPRIIVIFIWGLAKALPAFVHTAFVLGTHFDRLPVPSIWCIYSFAFCLGRCSHKQYNCYMLPGLYGGMCPLRRRLLGFQFTLDKHASHLIFNLIWHSFASPRRIVLLTQDISNVYCSDWPSTTIDSI